MTDEIKPALAPEEWAHIHRERMTGFELSCITAHRVERVVGAHAAAAVALKDQTFGFPSDLPFRLRVAAVALETDAAAFGVDNAGFAATVREAAKLIAALLPPEDASGG